MVSSDEKSVTRKILVTGFLPFLGERVNPSALLLEHLQNHPDLETRLLPVEFEGAFPPLQQALEKDRYEGVLLLGQASGSSQLRLERVALNIVDSSEPDEKGVIRHEEVLNAGAPSALLTRLSLRALHSRLKDRYPEMSISNSAGTYVCNATYFRTLHWISQNQRPEWALFLHVPYLPEQLPGKTPGTPSLPLEKSLAFILDLLPEIRRQKEK